MSETKNKKGKKAVAYEVVQVENNKLKLIEGRYALSTDELRQLDGMILNTESYKIVKDEKTGKVLRVQDNRTLSEMSADKYKKLLDKNMDRRDESR